MADVGRELADRELRKLERKLSHEYAQAEKELRKKREEFTKEYQKELKKKKILLEKGELSKERYKQWLEQQALYESWVNEMVDYMANEQVNVNRRAAEIMNNALPKVYAESYNFGTFLVENASGINTAFTLYNVDTVAKLVKKNPKLLPEANIDIPKDRRWNYQKMKTSLVQSILQGESVSKMAKRLRRVTDMNETSAIRNARTMFVGAENGGRFDSFQRAIDLGIEMKKMWSATMDNRTRNSHAVLDGETVELEEKFSNGLMYPGDPDGSPSEVYNCRCRLSAQLAGFERNNRHIVDGESVTEEQYLEWKNRLTARKGSNKSFTPKEIRRETLTELQDVLVSKNVTQEYIGKLLQSAGDVSTEHIQAIVEAIKQTDIKLVIPKGGSLDGSADLGNFVLRLKTSGSDPTTLIHELAHATDIGFSDMLMDEITTREIEKEIAKNLNLELGEHGILENVSNLNKIQVWLMENDWDEADFQRVCDILSGVMGGKFNIDQYIDGVHDRKYWKGYARWANEGIANYHELKWMNSKDAINLLKNLSSSLADKLEDSHKAWVSHFRGV